MQKSTRSKLTPRERARLERARTNGYLNAIHGSNGTLVQAHGFWCWRLRVPLLWFERKSPRSRFATLRLELFTTPHILTDKGKADLADVTGRFQLLATAAISTSDGVWESVPVRRVEEVARAVFRITTRLGSYELRQAAAHSGPKLLHWKKSA